MFFTVRKQEVPRLAERGESTGTPSPFPPLSSLTGSRPGGAVLSLEQRRLGDGPCRLRTGRPSDKKTETFPLIGVIFFFQLPPSFFRGTSYLPSHAQALLF